jgi:hypothetical protein
VTQGGLSITKCCFLRRGKGKTKKQQKPKTKSQPDHGFRPLFLHLRAGPIAMILLLKHQLDPNSSRLQIYCGKSFFSLFLPKNSIIKYLEHCVRFELTTEDTRYKALSDKGTNTYERFFFFLDFFKKAIAEAFFYLGDSLSNRRSECAPLKSLNLNAYKFQIFPTM